MSHHKARLTAHCGLLLRRRAAPRSPNGVAHLGAGVHHPHRRLLRGAALHTGGCDPPDAPLRSPVPSWPPDGCALASASTHPDPWAPFAWIFPVSHRWVGLFKLSDKRRRASTIISATTGSPSSSRQGPGLATPCPRGLIDAVTSPIAGPSSRMAPSPARLRGGHADHDGELSAAPVARPAASRLRQPAGEPATARDLRGARGRRGCRRHEARRPRRDPPDLPRRPPSSGGEELVRPARGPVFVLSWDRPTQGA